MDSAFSLEIESSIIADNVAGARTNDISGDGTTVTGSNNLVTAAAANVALPGNTLQSDPRLWPLADYGGVTHTMALRVGSPAVDAGINPLSLASDQRGAGFARVLGAAADIGAFEGTLAPAPVLPVPILPGGLAALLAALLGAGGWRTLRKRRASAIFVR